MNIQIPIFPKVQYVKDLHSVYGVFHSGLDLHIWCLNVRTPPEQFGR